jgi:hypothetical protein
MGIFDVFKTKVGEGAEKTEDVAEKAWDKAGEAAEQVKDKAAELKDKKKGAASTPSMEAATEEEASDMVSEGAPVSQTGEAAPGVGDDGDPVHSIEDNAARAGEKVDSGARRAGDRRA